MLRVAAYRAILAVIIALVLAVLSCGPLKEANPPSIAINFPADGSAVEVGETLEIVSTATAENGVAQVELSIDGQVVNLATPTSGNPTTFAAVQPWTPEAEGEVTLTVVAYDTEGATSDPATITLSVGVGGDEMTPTPTMDITITPSASPPTEETCTLDAEFVTSVTIPDNTQLSPGTGFTKVWRVRNSGTCDWESGYELIFASGDQMDGPSSVAVAAAPAGSTIDISVDLIAPAAYGGFTGVWRIRAQDGTVFGPELSLTIIVPEPSTIPPTSTSTATITPTATSTPTPTATPTTVPAVEIQHVANQISIDPGDIGHAVVSCPSGSVVTSGGFAVHPDVLAHNQSRSGNGWQVYAKNNAGISKLLNVYAYCISNSGGSSSQIINQVTAPSGGIGHGVASCPSGTVVTGGGWASNSDGSLTVYNSSKSGNSWQVYVKNTSGSDKLLNAYAICLSGTSASTTQAGVQVTIPAGDTGVAEATCGSGALATGGGFAANLGLYIYNTSMVSGSDTAWRTYAINSTGSSTLLNGYAVCISFP
jgi:hypothetical protein